MTESSFRSEFGAEGLTRRLLALVCVYSSGLLASFLLKASKLSLRELSPAVEPFEVLGTR